MIWIHFHIKENAWSSWSSSTRIRKGQTGAPSVLSQLDRISGACSPKQNPLADPNVIRMLSERFYPDCMSEAAEQ